MKSIFGGQKFSFRTTTPTSNFIALCLFSVMDEILSSMKLADQLKLGQDGFWLLTYTFFILQMI